MDCLGAHRLGAQTRTEVLARARVGADAEQVEADLHGLDDLERLEQADVAVVEGGVGEPVGVCEGGTAGFLERLDVVVLLGHCVAQHWQERLRRRARGALDRGGDEGDAEGLLGDEEVEDLFQALLVAAAALLAVRR